MLEEVCLCGGIRARWVPDHDSAWLVGKGSGEEEARRVTVWEVPLLESGWEERLRGCASRGVVVALMAFPDRESVVRARGAGAVGCLDLPSDLDVVGEAVLAALGSSEVQDALVRAETGHALPPRPRQCWRSGSSSGVEEARSSS